MRLIFAMLAVFAWLPCKAECGEKISMGADSLSHIGKLTLGEVTKRYGEWCQGHGPISWYRETSGKEIWFWWKKPAIELESKSGLDSYEVLLVAMVKPDEEKNQEIIWPSELKGKSVEKILSEAYRD